jgi:hypothetical protein
MDLGEKVLYHQIHPAKLTADVSGSLVSTYLMWRHKFVAALLSAFGCGGTSSSPLCSARLAPRL